MKKPWFCIVDESPPPKPWFRVLEVIESNGRSIADIVRDVATRHGVTLREIRGDRQTQSLKGVRQEIYRIIATERPDISSGAVAQFLKCDGSTVRHYWRKMARERVAA